MRFRRVNSWNALLKLSFTFCIEVYWFIFRGRGSLATLHPLTVSFNIRGNFLCSIYMHIRPQYMPLKDKAYVCSVVDLFVSGTYLAISCKVQVAVGLFGHIYAPMFGLYPHIEWGQCILFLNVAAIFVQ